jgi:opacity protein-like surface antigen
MRSNLLRGACAASMMLALAQAAQAADYYEQGPAGQSWYFSVFGGWSLPDEIEFSTVGSASTTTNVTAEIDLEDGFLAGLSVGAHFSEWARGEVEVSGHWHDAEGSLISTPVAGGVPGAPTTFALDGDADAMFVLANLWLDLPLGHVFRPYVGGGVGLGRLDLDMETSGGASVIDDDDWGFAYQLGAGVAFNVIADIALDIGYRYKVINNAELETDTTSPGGGFEFETDYKSHNFIAGLRFGF